ncbi:glycosyltransferase [bacterium]|nr:MAG: glycosyltransferase [bacterium]
MRLSVCLIVLNEASRLREALDSVREVADEIVVVDTGSTDGTPEFAASLGAQVYSFEWVDDFAAARNFAFAQARGEWILSIDADERLEDPSSLPPLEGDAFRVRIVDDGVESWRTRLFRRAAAPPMVGRIHELFDPPLAAQDSAVRLVHSGYSGGPSEEKHRRNLPLLEAELRERPERMDIRVELARTLAAVGDARAASAMDEALSHVDPTAEHAVPHVAMLMEAAMARPEGERSEWLRRPLVDALVERWFPSSPPLWWVLAREAAMGGDFIGAYRHLERLVVMAERGSYDRSIGFDARLLGPEPRLQLGGMLVRLGRLGEAREVFEELLGDGAVGVAAKANLQAVNALVQEKTA